MPPFRIAALGCLAVTLLAACGKVGPPADAAKPAAAASAPPAAAAASAPVLLLAPEDLRTLTSDPLTLEQRDDLPSFVPSLPATDFVAAARGLQGEDRLELILPHASPEQLTALFDLEAWRRDRVDIDRARVWLTAIVDAYAQSKERGQLGELMMDMDPELWTFALLPGTSVFHLDPDDDEQRSQARDAVEALYTYETPDGFFLVAVPDTETGHRAIHVLAAGVYHFRDLLARSGIFNRHFAAALAGTHVRAAFPALPFHNLLP